MNKRYKDDNIDTIWSDKHTERLSRTIWFSTLSQMHDAGFKDAFKKQKIPKFIESGHEVVDMLNRFIKSTGYVNAHSGLTSSDIIDNVRLYQCTESIAEVWKTLHGVFDALSKLKGASNGVECVGYTHWQVSSKMDMGDRVRVWSEMLSEAVDDSPIIHQKNIGGAIGNHKAIDMLCEQDTDIRISGMGKTKVYGLQSTTYIGELLSAQWLERMCGVISKICLDIRFLCHTGELSIKRGNNHVGSSAMPGKNNPKEAEQICSLARLIPNYSRVIWDAMSNNGMERTLDGSASTRVALHEMFGYSVYILSTFVNLIGKIRVNKKMCSKILLQNNRAATVEYRLAGMIKGGMSRMSAHKKLNEK